MRLTRAHLMSAAVCLAAAGAALVQAESPKIRPNLANTMQSAPEGQLIRIAIVMKDQVSADEIARATEGQTRQARRETVINLLKPHAATTQRELMGYLQGQQAEGTVGADIRGLWIANVIAAQATPAVIAEIAARPDVAYVHQDVVIGKEVFPDFDPGLPPVEAGSGGTAAVECGVNLMGAPQVWSTLGITGKGVVVGVIDTGLCPTHPDLRNQVWVNPGEIAGNGIDDDGNGYKDDINGWNFWLNTNDIRDTLWGHGTHVSGTVAGDGTNGQQTGMAPDAQLMSLVFWNDFAGETTIWEGMQYGVDNGADVETASLGWPHFMAPDRVTWRQVCENTAAAGVVVVYAAGNEGNFYGTDSVRTPGDVPGVITVGATDCADNLAWFSSQGPTTWQGILPYNDWPLPTGKIKPEISAPGDNTLSTWYDCNSYGYLSGTSMATPHVAGAIALMLEANPSLTHQQVLAILRATALDRGAAGEDNQYGAGRVRAFEAVQAALNTSGLHLDAPLTPFAGQANTFTMSGVAPGTRVYLAYSNTIGATPVPSCPGLSLNLAGARLAGSSVANSDGLAFVTGNVPASQQGRTTYLQATEVVNCTKSNGVSVTWK